jgi:hypothetical protein
MVETTPLVHSIRHARPRHAGPVSSQRDLIQFITSRVDTMCIYAILSPDQAILYVRSTNAFKSATLPVRFATDTASAPAEVL